MTLLVKEIYPAIIGESSEAGFPALLIRLSGCNLRCRYCDTKYAWKGGRRRTREELVKMARAKRYPRILLTGGEPLEQEESIDLMKDLLKAEHRILLETNGSKLISEVPSQVHIIMDLKTPGSGEDGANLYQNLDFLKSGDELKFVITNLTDYHWAKEMMREFELDRRWLVNFSPAFGILDPKKLARWMIRDRLNARLNLQQHKILFPHQTRGV